MLRLALLLAALPAAAVEIPPSWRCPKREETAYWKGLKSVAEAAGPAWGETLGEAVPAPFLWLVLYKNRDRDVAERRAPLDQRWAEFSAEEKCAYFRHYMKEAVQRKAEFDALSGWKQDGGLLKRVARMDRAEVAAAQDAEPLKGWRARFEAMAGWLDAYGLREEDRSLERAHGVFIKVSQLEKARLDFLLESRWFEAKVRRRMDEALKERPSLAAALADPTAREAVTSELVQQLSKDWTNERILGAELEGRALEALKAYQRGQAVQAESQKAEAVQKATEERRAALKRAEAVVERLEGELKSEKLQFDAGADPELLVSLEEYRQGKLKLAEDIAAKGEPGDAELKKRYLGLLRSVCVTHYTSIRYKAEAVKTLCGS